MNNRVVITGVGWITPMGHSVESVWKRLLNSESGIARTTLFDASTFPTTFSAEVKNFDLASHIPNPADHPQTGRNTQFALAACAQAWQMANLPPLSTGNSQLATGNLDLDNVGIYL